jgi:excisionase family DNA binding protein
MENTFEIINEKLNTIEQILLEIKQEQRGTSNSKSNAIEFMNVTQVAEYLSLAKATIYGMVHKLEIPNYKQGKRLYFKKADIDQWLTKSRRKTREEIEEEAADYIIRKKMK